MKPNFGKTHFFTFMFLIKTEREGGREGERERERELKRIQLLMKIIGKDKSY